MSSRTDTSRNPLNAAHHGDRAVQVGLVLRPVLPEDAEGIHALLIANSPYVIGDRRRWLSQWMWKYGNNPFRQDRPAGWILAEGDRLIGHLGAIYMPIRFNEESLAGVMATDFVVAGQIIGLKREEVGSNLLEAFLAAADDCVVLANPANEEDMARFADYGCQPVQSSRQWWRAPTTLLQEIHTCHCATSRIARLLSRLGGAVLLGPAERGYRLLGHRPGIPIPRGCRLETTVPQLARDLGSLYERVAAEQTRNKTHRFSQTDHLLPLAIDHNQDYLDWRYTHHPERENLRVLMVRDEDADLLGACVVYLDERGTQLTVLIEELIVFPGCSDVIRTLLCAALKLACDHKADALVTMTGKASFQSIFNSLGFQHHPQAVSAVMIQEGCIGSSTDPNPSSILSHERNLEFWHGALFGSDHMVP